MTLFDARWGFGLAPTNAIMGLDDKICWIRTSEYSTGRQLLRFVASATFALRRACAAFMTLPK